MEGIPGEVIVKELHLPIYYCDRCKRDCTHSLNQTHINLMEKKRNDKRLDLCDNCADEFKQFLGDRNASNNDCTRRIDNRAQR